ncbi:uncharacterized protein LOC111058281 [Nilaparvata lugens]|uniref:uncharacterized protein LOC111058281 n=1 Tax=Nilaparvata lugens TaxID=108931 RepID=UPI00193D5BDC|nr:uncharacterized protein LOC111058281 [Nilaparvata lugens]XP_039279550.1 uncharacterized protein LOC111058281 [Nilaparvata lugens]
MDRNNELSIFSTRELQFSKVEDEILTSMKNVLSSYSDTEAVNKMKEFVTNSQERAFHVNRACEMICELTHCAANQRQLLFVYNPSYHSQQFKLLIHLFDYFSSSSENITKIAVFLTLFSAEHSKRWQILAKLVSMAISVDNADILFLTSILGCQLSVTSEFCSLIVDRTIYDFIFLYPDNIGKLKTLPLSVPTFCNIFIRTVTEMYGRIDGTSKWTNVPNIILEVLIEWIEKYSSQLTSMIDVDNKQPRPTTIGQTMCSTLSPYPVLVKWIVLSSLYEDNEKSQQLFVKLHNSVCGSLVKLREGFNRKLIPASTFIFIIERIKTVIELGTSHEKLDDCLIRLSQVVQVSMHSKAIYGDFHNLPKELDDLLSLKPNRLLHIIVECLKNEMLTP